MKLERDFIYDPSLVLYLPLYELDVASFQSKDAYGHLCTVTGALWRPSGRYFDGADDYISIPNHSGFAFTSSDFSIMAWVKLDKVTDFQTIFVHGDWYVRGYWFFVNAAKLQLGTYQSSAEQNSYTGSVLSAGTWYHLAVTRVGASVKLYVDAVDRTSTAASHTDPATSSATAYVGAYNPSEHRLAGTIGEARIYNRALTPLEIQHIYLATKWRYR